MRAFGRLFTSRVSGARPFSDRSGTRRISDRQSFRRAGLAFVLLLLFVSSSPRSAQAKVDAIGIAVDALVVGGSYVGVNIPSEAAGFVKELVGCAVDGKSVPECARESVVKAALKNVPEEGKQFAACLAGGGNVGKCGTDEVLKKVPEQARPLAQCVIQGNNVASCAERFALNQVQGVIDEQTKKATQEALDTLKQLKADAEDAMEKELPGSVRNIILLVQGINDGDVEKIILGGGPEVAKVVITTVINVVLTPAFAPIVGPVVNVMVQERVDLVADILKAIKEGDVVLVGEVIFQFYLQTMVSGACALIPDGAFKDATCGNLAKAIGAVAGVAGDAVDAILGVAGDYPGRRRHGCRGDRRLHRRRLR